MILRTPGSTPTETPFPDRTVCRSRRRTLCPSVRYLRRKGRGRPLPSLLARACGTRHGGADRRLFARRRGCEGEPLRPARRRRQPALDLWLCLSVRSEEHTSELQSLMRISYAVFCLNIKKTLN